jgi:hypothetical protein
MRAIGSGQQAADSGQYMVGNDNVVLQIPRSSRFEKQSELPRDDKTELQVEIEVKVEKLSIDDSSNSLISIRSSCHSERSPDRFCRGGARNLPPSLKYIGHLPGNPPCLEFPHRRHC